MSFQVTIFPYDDQSWLFPPWMHPTFQSGGPIIVLYDNQSNRQRDKLTPHRSENEINKINKKGVGEGV